jgi:hypothetical protein
MSVEYVANCVIKDMGNMEKHAFFVVDEQAAIDGIPPSEIALNIKKVFKKYAPYFTKFTVAPVLIRPMSISIDVFVDRNLIDIGGLAQTIRDYIYKTYEAKTQEIGKDFKRMELQYRIETISEAISYTIMNKPVSDLRISWNEIIEIRDIDIQFHRATSRGSVIK